MRVVALIILALASSGCARRKPLRMHLTISNETCNPRYLRSVGREKLDKCYVRSHDLI